MGDDHKTGAESAAAELEAALTRVAELEAAAARGRFAATVIERMPDGFVALDGDGVHVDVNPAFCRMTGFSRDELLGAGPPHPYWPPEEYDAIGAAFAAAMNATHAPLRLTFMRKDGERFPALITPTLTHDDLGDSRWVFATFKDISELERTERALEVSRTDFRALVENISEVFARYDLDLRFTYVSPVIARWVPMSPDAMVGKTNREAGFPPELADLFDDVLRRTVASGTPAQFDYRIPGHGIELVAQSSVYPDLAADGTVIGVTSVAHDITERVHAEEALRESEEKYRAVVERANDAVLIIDAERCLFANAAAARLSGYTVDELRGIPIAAVVPPATREQLLERARRRLAGEDLPATYVTDLVNKDGSLFKAEVSAGAIPYEGAVANLLYVREVTERERVATELRRSNAMRDITERVARVGSYRWDLATAEVTYSPEMFRLFDVDPETFDGDFMKVVGARVHSDDRDRLLRTIEEFQRTGEARPQDFRVVHRDGSVHTLYGDAHLERGAEGDPPAIVGYYRDVTEEHAARERIRLLNAELEDRVATRTAHRDALNRELEAFAYSISHDVRAPLRAIDGFSAIVLDDARDRLEPADVGHLQRVRDAAQRMGALIDDLLGLSRMSQREFVRTHVDVSALAASVGAELHAEAPGREVELTVAPDMVAWADPALLRVVFRELLENAWKFTAGHDPAHVEVGPAGEPGGAPAYFVRDDGVGYDPSYAEHLFGAFQRMHPAAQFPGNGIGLATVQRLVARHGGSVWADARPGEGATFRFSLPAQTPEADEDVTP